MLSVVVPVYNVEKYLDRCIKSIIEDKASDVEIILIDDGSTDSSGAICDNYASIDNRIKVVHKENGGLQSAWIHGVSISTRPYIAFVDSDDYISGNLFADILGLLGGQELDLILYDFYLSYDNNDVRRTTYLNEGYYVSREVESIDTISNLNRVYDIDALKNSYLKKDGVNPCRWNKVYKKTILLECISYCDNRITMGEDINITLIYLDKIKNAFYKKTPYLHYYQNPASIMNSFKDSYFTSYKYLFDALNSYFTDNRDIALMVAFANIKTFVQLITSANIKNKIKRIKSVLKDDFTLNILKNINKNIMSFKDKLLIFLFKRKMAMSIYILSKINK